jgi:maltodextrin utilization protein YvdJ
LSFLKSKDKMNNSRTAITDKTMEELAEWQRQADTEKENRLKYQYENDFLKNRNKDLESQREELEKLLAYKQKEIIKLRE